MQVETLFDIQETKELETDKGLEEYNSMCIDLGLDNLCISKDSGVNGIPIMTLEERKIYEYLLQDKKNVEEYKSVIPKRVLQSYAKCKKMGWLEDAKSVQVWEDEKVEDPILVAKFDWAKYGIIARWGNELLSFAELKKIAIKRKLMEIDDQVFQMERYLKSYKKDPEKFCESIIISQNVNNIYF